MEVNRPVEIDIQVQWLTSPTHSSTCIVLDDFAVMILVFIFISQKMISHQVSFERGILISCAEGESKWTKGSRAEQVQESSD